MLALIATAHSWRGGDGPYTLAPILGLLLSLVLIRTVLGSRLGLGSMGASVALGALFATLGERWGYSLTAAAWVLAFALAGLIVRAAPGPLRRNPSD